MRNAVITFELILYSTSCINLSKEMNKKNSKIELFKVLEMPIQAERQKADTIYLPDLQVIDTLIISRVNLLNLKNEIVSEMKVSSENSK